MKSPQISVIVTAYNDAKYLPKSLEALINQDLSEIEIICIDDASTDESVEVIKKYAKQDERISYIVNTENVGLSEARNIAMKKVKAPYIMFCDADDTYQENMCSTMLKAMTKHDVEMAICEINVVYKAHREMKFSDDTYYALKYSGTQNVTDNLILSTDFSVTNKIFKKELLDKYDLWFPKGLRYEDAYFSAAYFCLSKKVYYVNERLYNYVRHNNSIMSQTWTKDSSIDFAIDHLYVIMQLYDFLEQHDLLKSHNQLYWQLFDNYVRLAIHHSKSRAVIKKIRNIATEFVQAHQETFQKVHKNIRESIQHVCSTKPYISTTRLKRAVIKVMPTYKLEVANIQRLRMLKSKNAQLNQRIDKLTDSK